MEEESEKRQKYAKAAPHGFENGGPDISERSEQTNRLIPLSA